MKFEIEIFEFFAFELEFWNSISQNFSKQANIKKTSKFSARHLIVVLFAFKPIESRLYFSFPAPQFDIYLVFMRLGRPPTIRYTRVFDENTIPLEDPLYER